MNSKDGAPLGSAVGLSRIVGKNTFYGIVASVFQVGTRLFTVPFIIYHVGLGGYGIWSIIMTVTTYMRFGSAGIKSAFQKYVAEATGDGRYARASELLSTGTAIFAVVSAVGLIPVIFFSRQLASAAGVPARFLQDSAWAFSVLALTMAFANSGAAYEAIVLGGHRIDLARKANSLLTVMEAVAIIAVLHFGFGLFAMACVMAASELIYLISCYAAAHRVVPEVHVKIRFVTRKVAWELARFAGSFQLVNVLQISYTALVPVILLHSYGAEAAGIYAVASRLVGPVSMCHNAFLLSILSGGAMVYATRESEKLRKLVAKSFKVTLALTLIPLALISFFGVYMVQVWTGRADPAFHYAIWLICSVLFVQAFSTVAVVLYRASGGALMDNLFQLVRLCAFLPVIGVATKIGFRGVLYWMLGAEFIGMLVMMFAMTRSFRVFETKLLAGDATRWIVATGAIIGCSAAALHVVPDVTAGARMLAGLRVCVVGLAALLSAFPALYFTGAISGAEIRSVVKAFRGPVGVASAE